ncbi:MAG: SET domain-containing protein [Caulobacteraceae bacterium]|nr:SET domain-containing protein [Caulobacteraceae bacterium]
MAHPQSAHEASPGAAPRRRQHGCPDGLTLRGRAGGETLCAARPFEAGEPVFQLTRVTWRAEPDRHTVPHPSGRHLFDPLLDRLGRAREPNCRIAPDLMAVIARRDIAAGEPLTVGAPAEH